VIDIIYNVSDIQCKYNENLINHLGVGGKGIGGSLMSGIILIKEGFGGGTNAMFIPPFANGISGAIIGCFIFLSLNIGGLKISEGILLFVFGLFSANSLSAKVPCFSPFESFFTPYYTRI
jgi:hypothetical protein